MGTNVNSFDEKFRQLRSHISSKKDTFRYSDMFSSSKQNHEKVGMAYCLLGEAKLLPEYIDINPKSANESKLFRVKGNTLFFQKKDIAAIQTYSVSAAFAPPNSEELALAFANRSAVTFSLKEYTTCLKDIDMALAGCYPDHLRYKLYERKGNCLKLLGMNKAAKDVLQLALTALHNSHIDEDKLTKITTSLNKQLNSCSENDVCFEIKKNCLPCLSEDKNSIILSASSLVRIEYSQELGRHLVATANIEPGDVLVIEEPFASVLLPASYNNFCFHCKKRCHALIPCLHCVVAMYCSESCQSASWNENHRVECNLVPLLVALDFTKIELIAVRTLLMATKQNKLLKELLETIPQMESSADPKTRGFDDKGCYDSANYQSVHHLVGNMELRSNPDVFRRAATAAYILHLLDKNTDYFTSAGVDEFTEATLSSKSFQSLQLLNPTKFIVGGLLFKYLMIVPSNAHEISEMFLKKVDGAVVCESIEIGGALYPVLSLINHSCDPNVVRHSHNGDLNILTAIQSIPAGDQIFDNYGYHHAMHDLSTRQTKLWSQYYFHCQCRACTEDWPIYSHLPNSNPVSLSISLKDEVAKSSEIFHDVVAEIKLGVVEGKLPFLFAHLSLLQRTIKRPWKEYSECQEAIKQCLSLQANHYISY